jgi:fatty-acyl-CoA synthase
MSLPRLPFSGAHWVDHVARHAYATPDGAAIRFEGATITWAELHERIGALAAAFTRCGVRKGDRVAVLMTNRPEFVEATLAANALGAVAVPVNFRLTSDEAGYILRHCGAALIATDTRVLPLAMAATKGHPIPTIVAGLDPAAATGGLESDTDLVTHVRPRQEVSIDERDIALIMYTSARRVVPREQCLPI